MTFQIRGCFHAKWGERPALEDALNGEPGTWGQVGPDLAVDRMLFRPIASPRWAAFWQGHPCLQPQLFLKKASLPRLSTAGLWSSGGGGHRHLSGMRVSHRGVMSARAQLGEK